MSTTKNPMQFALLSRILHWLMAALLLAMLFIGVSMVSSLGDYHKLLTTHRPLGILILILAAIRLVTRLLTNVPALPLTMSQQERFVAKASERLLYTVFFALPLPPILPARPEIYAHCVNPTPCSLISCSWPFSLTWAQCCSIR